MIGRHALVSPPVAPATGKPISKAIKVGPLPIALAITPDGKHVYVVKN